MNPEIQEGESAGGRNDVITIYPPNVDSSVSSNVKCVLHQFVDERGDKRLILSLEPGDYRLAYTDEFDATFHTLRVLTGTAIFQGVSVRIEASEGTSHRMGDDRAYTVSSGGFTQLELSDAEPLDENKADPSPEDYRNRFWLKAMPKPKGPRPPLRSMMVNITAGTPT